MRRGLWIVLGMLLGLVLVAPPATAKVLVFWQPGFPTVATAPVTRASLEKALVGQNPGFADLAALQRTDTLAQADLLVLPYGSAVPVAAWKSLERYLKAGGNLLVLGGQPLRVPVRLEDGLWVAGDEQDTYSRALGFRHTYSVPVPSEATFQWKTGYSWLPKIAVRANRYFTVEGRLNGLGYMADANGLLVAAPVIVADREGGRIVALDFDAQPGYWSSADGIALLQAAAEYARQGVIDFSVEVLDSAIRPGESPAVIAHLRRPQAERQRDAGGEVDLRLQSATGVPAKITVPLAGPVGAAADIPVVFPISQSLLPGFYTVSAVFRHNGRPLEFYQNGFWVSDPAALEDGPALGVHGDFLSLDGQPFLPVGTNYFTTEENGWDFSGPRNAAVWEHDFADMAAHGITLVRTGVWMSNAKFITGSGGVNQRFLRNLEAFLLCAQRHKIAVNFTFFAFSPRSAAFAERNPDAAAPQPNPYIDPAAVAAQKAYARSVVERFRHVPWLSWDLINEPSFSNPAHIFSGNYPNGDAAEAAAWRAWLARKYPNLDALGEAWRVPNQDWESFDSVPLPTLADLRYERYGNPNQVRALDYNLFAQEMFGDWVKGMVALIRSTGSTQLINVGQDEGGVTDRVLNQFYGGAGISFTTNHTYWQDDALLWDSVAAKRPGMPNISGETGYQPAWDPDGAWRLDEFTGLGLTERKWALGFAAGSSGVMQWDWAREVDFGMERSDGSAKVWQSRMRDLGQFARQAAPYADSLIPPQVALVLPQSDQLSVAGGLAIEAQKAAVRALFHYAHSQAYVVGEYQIEQLGSPKLILLPSPYALAEAAWQAILQRVRQGSVLLITGPFAADPHRHPTSRQDSVGIPYRLGALALRDQRFLFPGGALTLEFAGNKTTVLDQAFLPDGSDWTERTVGKGRILFSTLPLELNTHLEAVATVYRYALQVAHVMPTFTTSLKRNHDRCTQGRSPKVSISSRNRHPEPRISGRGNRDFALNDPGILICPTLFPKATLYALTSESNRSDVAFTDARSGRTFAGTLPAGRAALLLVGTDGKLLAAYNWPNP